MRPSLLPLLLPIAVLTLASDCDREDAPLVAGPAAETPDVQDSDLSAVAAPTTNVILVVADDLGYYDLCPTGNDFVRTPHLQRMADEGLLFTQSYASGAVCSPSRVAIQSGITPGRLGITEHFHGPTEAKPWMKVIPPDNEPNLDVSYHTLAEDMRRTGYARRLYVGKWHAGANGPINHGYSGHYGGAAGYWLNSQYHWPYWNGVDPNGDGPYAQVVRDSEEGDYLTDVLTDRVLTEITEAAEAEEAFFLAFNLYAPHVPLDGKPELVAKYEAAEASYSGDFDMDPVYAAMVETIDDNMGRILDTLQALRLRENTVVLFTSDNGGLADQEQPPFDPHTPATNNGPLRGGKGHVYEGGTRVPLLAWGGPVPQGMKTDVVHMGHDLYPSIVNLVGGTVTGDVEGADLSSVYRGGADPDPERELVWHYPHYSNQGGVPRSSIRRGDMKLIYDWGDSTAQVYDLRADLGEDDDLAGELDDARKALETRLMETLEAQGAKLPRDNPGYRP